MVTVLLSLTTIGHNQTKYVFMEIINTFKQSTCIAKIFDGTTEDGSAVEIFCNNLFKCTIGQIHSLDSEIVLNITDVIVYINEYTN